MRYRQMKEVLAALERADGCFLVYGALAEQPDEDWWVAVRDTQQGTDHQIDDDARFQRTFPDLDRPALVIVNPSFPDARLTWIDVLRLIPRLEGYYPAGKLDKIVLTAEGYYVIGMWDETTGRGLFITSLDDLP
jgi:hypothetical protein